ncbi:MAG: AarF/ABC1/UbiB kinase family protein, partial [Haloarculaceae archaeon]
RVQQIVQQVEDTIYEFPLRLPSNLALILRVATVVEGVCVTLDPDFDFIEVATDYLRGQGYLEAGVRQFFEDRVDEVQAAARSTLRTPPKLERTLDKLDREDLQVDANIVDSDGLLQTLAKQLIFGMIVSAGVLATAVLYAFETAQSAAVAAAVTLLVGALLYWSFRAERGIRTKPQFTRQAMRRDEERQTEGGSVGPVGFETDVEQSDDVAAANGAEADDATVTHVDVTDGADDEP